VTTWVVIVAVGAGSFAFRWLPLRLHDGLAGSACLNRLIRHAGAGATSALAVSSLRDGATSGAMPALAIAAIVGLIVALRGGTILRVVVTGSVVYGTLAGVLSALG